MLQSALQYRTLLTISSCFLRTFQIYSLNTQGNCDFTVSFYGYHTYNWFNGSVTYKNHSYREECQGFLRDISANIYRANYLGYIRTSWDNYWDYLDGSVTYSKWEQWTGPPSKVSWKKRKETASHVQYDCKIWVEARFLHLVLHSMNLSDYKTVKLSKVPCFIWTALLSGG